VHSESDYTILGCETKSKIYEVESRFSLSENRERVGQPFLKRGQEMEINKVDQPNSWLSTLLLPFSRAETARTYHAFRWP
jgi:hypothetical protein